jgi:hypothetical protein
MGKLSCVFGPLLHSLRLPGKPVVCMLQLVVDFSNNSAFVLKGRMCLSIMALEEYLLAVSVLLASVDFLPNVNVM